jgi:hypothetical protein
MPKGPPSSFIPLTVARPDETPACRSAIDLTPIELEDQQSACCVLFPVWLVNRHHRSVPLQGSRIFPGG